MTVTVKKMIEDGGYYDFSVLAGHAGLNSREVKTVCVIDTPDIFGWIRGGEFLISSGFIFRDDPLAMVRVVEDSAAAGAAAFGVKVDRFLGSIPKEVFRAADLCSFPLIEIPAYYNHNDIINPVLTNLINSQAKLLDLSESVRNDFFEIIMNDGDIERILERLRAFLKRDVMFIDAYDGKRIAVGSEHFRNDAAMQNRETLLQSYRHEQVRMADRTYGYLLLGDGESSDPYDEIPMTHAKTTLLLRLQRDLAQRETERRYIEQFVQDILRRALRTPQEIWDRARIYRWHLEGPQVVLFFKDASQSPPESTERQYRLCLNMLASRFGSFPHSQMNGGLVCILPQIPQEWQSFKETLAETLETILDAVASMTGSSPRVGVGSPRENIFLCDKGFREAQKSLDLTQTTPRSKKTTFWDDLGVYRILTHVHTSEDARDFVDSHLAALIEYDGEGKDALVSTLAAIIRHNWHLKSAASELGIHYNTIKYRFRKICELLGEEELEPTLRLELFLAVELLEMGKNDR